MAKKALGKGLGAFFGDEAADTQTDSTESAKKAPAEKTGKVRRATGKSDKTDQTKGSEATELSSDLKSDADMKKPVIVEKIVEKPVEQTLKLSLIEPNAEQPRKSFQEEELQELAESIKKYGILQPLLVQKVGTHYQVIAGERRWRAAKLAGVTEVPVVIREYNKQQSLEVALIENVQRSDLNPIEEAQAYQKLAEQFDLTQEEIADRVFKNRVTITNAMRLLKLDPRVQKMVSDGQLSGGHARALLGLSDPEIQYQAGRKIVQEKLSVRETEKLVKSLSRPKKEKKPQNGADVNLIYHQIEESLKAIIGTKVIINRKDKNKGRIEIEYYSQEELERIIELMQSVKG